MAKAARIEYENPDGKGWVKCDQETMLKFIDLQIAFTKKALGQIRMARDVVKSRGMHPWGSLEIIAAPMATGFTLYDKDNQESLEFSTAMQWPEKI